MITLRFPDKDPASQENYEVTFDDELAKRFPVTIVSVVWTVVPIVGDAAPAVVVGHSEDSPITSSVVAVSGGTLHNEYTFRGFLTYSDGETEYVSFVLPIEYT